jgi:Cft2 family RNA processing exonuclease
VIEFTNLTRANEIGANCYLLDFDGDGRVIVDVGMHPRAEGLDATPNMGLAKFDTIDAIFVSHAHHDHIGALPVLMRDQPHARVFMSEPTYFLGEPLLHNSVEIMLKQRTEKGIAEFPLFTHKELDAQSRVWQAVGLERPWTLDGSPQDEKNQDPVSFTFHDAGHILGSVGIAFNHKGRTIFYTGDVNFQDQTLMRAASFPETNIDTLIIETTRGANPRKEGFTRTGEIARLAESIRTTFERGGAVMIPVFAMGKTQEALASLHLLQRRGEIPHCPIYIGGLGRSFTQVYDRLAARTPRAHANLHLLEDVRPQIMDGRIAREIKPKRGHIYLISSGMMTENTLSNLLAQKFLSEPRHSIFFIGYCDPESPAGKLLATAPHGTVTLHPATGEQTVQCSLDRFDLTAHAQREDLLHYILTVDPRVCVLIHGDQPALEWFQQELAQQRPKMQVIIPPAGETLKI